MKIGLRRYLVYIPERRARTKRNVWLCLVDSRTQFVAGNMNVHEHGNITSLQFLLDRCGKIIYKIYDNASRGLW